MHMVNYSPHLYRFYDYSLASTREKLRIATLITPVNDEWFANTLGNLRTVDVYTLYLGGPHVNNIILFTTQ